MGPLTRRMCRFQLVGRDSIPPSTLVEKMFAAVARVIGQLDGPHPGFRLVTPVSQVWAAAGPAGRCNYPRGSLTRPINQSLPNRLTSP